jgi:hypothetical protein
MEHYLSPLPIPIYVHDFKKDLGLPEHTAGLPSRDSRVSFEDFTADVAATIHALRGKFSTISNRHPFEARVEENGEVVFTDRHGKKSVIRRDDLFGIWTLLLKGPVSRQRLSGAARDAAYLLFPLLANLPYIRAIEIGQVNKSPAMQLNSSTPISRPENWIRSTALLQLIKRNLNGHKPEYHCSAH